MRDYVTGQGLSEESKEEDVDINLALFPSNPVHFEEALKHDKWRTTMDMEIQAIERNNTWEFIVLCGSSPNSLAAHFVFPLKPIRATCFNNREGGV